MNPIKTDDLDHELITRFKKGSMEAMEKIVERYEEPLFNFGLRVCGHPQDAEDIMQETFLNAFKSLQDFREETKLKNWLFKIAANACYRKRRKKKFEPDRELSLEELGNPDKGPQAFEIPDWSNNPSDDLLRTELKEVIAAAIVKLPPKYRMVFNLRDLQGFNTEETAEILGITPQSVKTRLHRARLFLRKEISGHYKESAHHA
ncbi:MAG: sigma-70 family RNA polymerase sigma factor [Deltaproteobacteria bacterium]|nr:sigma-70 family RNA polymerase sigma factor [Deltaproteobacteria bacterium]MBW2017534.1 sigma-70 family RNA polymerase sigma factor [Deltaproteobacteria bacterium]MBW2128052.1 sigma-70 family RNA polymerase sigma factor [Deltaproteobacteria bacterium]MBW2304072.1 sigma-70 family RNA polymerase sigma factor [Deltaproteobacteria bacterium]